MGKGGRGRGSWYSGSSGYNNWGKGKGNNWTYGWQNDDDYWERRDRRRDRDNESPPRDRDRDRSRRESGREKARVERLRNDLADLDPDYAAYLQEKDDLAAEQKLRRQGEALAASLKSTHPGQGGGERRAHSSVPAEEAAHGHHYQGENGLEGGARPDSLSRSRPT